MTPLKARSPSSGLPLQLVPLMLLCIVTSGVWGADGKALVEERCNSCHQVSVPEPGTLTLQERTGRKGPPLYYAGHKYRREWLQQWLQDPVRITPGGGAYWANAVVVTVEGDEVDPARLSGHMAVNTDESAAISDYLMGLKPYPELIRKGEYTPAGLPRMLAEKDFRKFKGCIACHQDEEGFGGVTGPELYTAMERLQAEYIASYIRSPTAWEPRSLMPENSLNDEPIHRLMHYLNMLSEDAE